MHDLVGVPVVFITICASAPRQLLPILDQVVTAMGRAHNAGCDDKKAPQDVLVLGLKWISKEAANFTSHGMHHDQHRTFHDTIRDLLQLLLAMLERLGEAFLAPSGF